MSNAVTVIEVIQRSAEFLSKKGVDSPRLQIELLLAHVLKVPRLNLYLDFNRTLTEPELGTLRPMVKRRGNREPLQYIIGSTSFCGLEIHVTSAVLIPRPETELLAERAYTFLTSSAALADKHVSFFELGTGSGCLAIALAFKCQAARGDSVDISKAALAVARENAERHQVSGRLQFLQGDGFAALARDLRFDLIVSNPPYIPTAEIATLAPEVRDHDPHVALDGGADGLKFYHRLAEEAGSFLRPNGKLMMEFGDGQAQEIQRILTASRWAIEKVEADYSGRPRILIAHRQES